MPGDMCTINEDHMIYSSCNIRCDRRKFSTFLTFLTLKKTPGDIIILYICITNDNHMIYGSWDMEHDRQFFVIPNCFLPFYPPMDPKIKIFKEMEKIPEDIIILQK